MSSSSAVRAEIREGDEDVKRVLCEEIRAGEEATRREMREGHVMIVTALTEQIQEVRRHA